MESCNPHNLIQSIVCKGEFLITTDFRKLSTSGWVYETVVWTWDGHIRGDIVDICKSGDCAHNAILGHLEKIVEMQNEEEE